MSRSLKKGPYVDERLLAKLAKVKRGEKTISKLTIKTQQEADDLVKNLQNAVYKIEKVEKKNEFRC